MCLKSEQNSDFVKCLKYGLFCLDFNQVQISDIYCIFQIVLERCDHLVSNHFPSNTSTTPRPTTQEKWKNRQNGDDSQSLSASRPRRSVKRQKFFDGYSDDSMADDSSDDEICKSKRQRRDQEDSRRYGWPLFWCCHWQLILFFNFRFQNAKVVRNWVNNSDKLSN